MADLLGALRLRLSRWRAIAPCTPIGPTRAAVFFMVLFRGPSPDFSVRLAGVRWGFASQAVASSCDEILTIFGLFLATKWA